MTEDRLFFRIARASGYAFAGKVGAKLLGLGHYVILYFAVLHAEGYGQFSFVLAYVGIFAGFAEGGICSIFVRELNRTADPFEKSRLFASALSLLFIQGFVFWSLAVFGLLAFPQFADLPERNLVLFYTTIILAAPYAACESVFKASLDMRVPVWSNLIRYVVFLVLVLPWSPIDTLEEIVVLWWACFVGGTLVVGFLAWRRLRPVWVRPWEGIRSLLRESLPLFLTRFATISYYRIDQVMLRMFFPDQSDQLAWYVSAVKLTEAANMIPAVLLEGIYPALTGLWKVSRQAFDEAVRRVWVLFLGLAGTMVFFVTALLPWILSLSFMEELRPARIPLVLLTSTEGLIFMNLLLFQVLIAAGFQRRLVAVTTLMVFLNALLNLVLFKTLFASTGHVGASVSTLVTEAFGLLFQVFLMRSLLKGTLTAWHQYLLGGFLLGVAVTLSLSAQSAGPVASSNLVLSVGAILWSGLFLLLLRTDCRSLWTLFVPAKRLD